MLPALAAPKLVDLWDELARYLSTDPEQVQDVLLWWTEQKSTFPRLSRMALDYLTIPGESLLTCSAILLTLVQPLQQMLNMYLAKEESFCHTFETACHCNPFEH